MACIQMLRSSPLDFKAKFNDLRTSIRRSYRIYELNCRRLRVSCKVGDNDKNNNEGKGEEPPESLFMKELKRRGMTPTSLLEEKNSTASRDEEVKFKEEDGGWNYSRRNGVSTDEERKLSNQRETSMALNSEGLEGLLPRAKLLLTLGGTFFLAFWPLILVTVAFFTALYLYFGPDFVHDGSRYPSAPPEYIDPYDLLEDDKIYKTAPPLPN